MTGNELEVIAGGRAVTVDRIPQLPYVEFWALAEQISRKLKWDVNARCYTLREPPTAVDRALIQLATALASSGKLRNERKTPEALKLELGKLVLHYPVKRLSEEQFSIWANAYHTILAPYPDELIQYVCTVWLGEVADRMPAAADLKARCENRFAIQKIYTEHCLCAAGALATWDSENQSKAVVNV